MALESASAHGMARADGSSEMMATRMYPQVSLRETVEALLVPDLTGPLDELSDVLLHVAGLVARLRRCQGTPEPSATEWTSLDESFSRSISLTRALRERVQASRARGDYASVSHAAREVVGRLQGAMPDCISLSLRCPPGPAIVAGDRDALRRLMVALLDRALQGVAKGGTVELDVSEGKALPSHRPQPVVVIELCSSGTLEEHEERVGLALRRAVSALGGSVASRERARGGTVIAVRLPSAC
jgi:signal transduction histidine kinase